MIDYVLGGGTDPLSLALPRLPAGEEEPDKSFEDVLRESTGNEVILEDGAPF